MKILWSLLLAALLISCSKSDSDALPSDHTQTPSDNTNQGGKLIQSYLINKKWEYKYNYNQNKRLDNIEFEEDGQLQYTETFTYDQGKIVASVKKDTDGSNTTKKQFEYKDDLIVKQKVNVNDESFETYHFYYNKNKFLERVLIEAVNNGAETTTNVYLEKLGNENKIRVKKDRVATHVISYDDKLAPLSNIPAYQPIVKIDNNGIIGNILLTEIFVANKCSTKIEEEFTFDKDKKTILSSRITYRYGNKVISRGKEYKY